MRTDAEQQRGVTTTYNVLFVCTGNTCRSPMAEVLALREVRSRHWSHVRVRSAGVAAHPGSAASEHAVDAAREVGLDLSGHAATLLDPHLVEWADVVLAMSPSHLEVIDEYGGSHKTALLGEFANGAEGPGDPVPDPFGGDAATYRATLSKLERLVSRSLDRLEAIVQP